MTDAETTAFLDAVTPAVRHRDALTMVELLRRVTGEEPRMCYSSIVGAGHYTYRYDSGREGEGPSTSFSPRKTALTVYLADGTAAHADRLARLGEHTSAVGCVYLKDLAKVDLAVLEEIISASHRALTAGVYTARAREGGRS
ncbi:MAG: DUF1801 domain-containing protein [Actinobacteria bacterium]|nr:DUF1801 domain-containing protein [Actinomycetota bacterium]